MTTEKHALSQPGYSIGVVARLTGITTHTLRMWERRYGLKASRRTATGQREFTRTDLDHLKLVKRLLEQGMRIGDIAHLPQKTLSGLCSEDACLQEAPTEQTPLKTAVIGDDIGRFMSNHCRRYPRLDMHFSELSAQQWCASNPAEQGVKVAIMALDVISQGWIKRFEKLRGDNITVAVIYQYASAAVKEEIEAAGILLVRGHIDAIAIDSLANRIIKQQQFTSALQQSADKFNVPLPASIPKQFDEQSLQHAASQQPDIACECPSHLADLIRSLNAFEQYSQNCEADNWGDAAVHAVIYSYTCQARHLMEKALLAVTESHQR